MHHPVGRRPRHREHPVDPHRPGDVFDRPLAQRFELQGQLVLDLVVGAAGNTNSARVGQTFQTCGNIDAVPVQSAFFRDHVAKINPNPELHGSAGRQLPILLRKFPLNFDSGSDSVHDTAELGQNRVPRRVYDSTVMLVDL